jgi:hypothetical protein
MNEERVGKCLRKVVPRSMIYVFQITMHTPHPPQYLPTFIRAMIFVDILLVSLLFLFFSVLHWNNTLTLRYWRSPCIGQEKKLLSASFCLFLLSWFHFLLYFYVYHTIHFSDRKWYFVMNMEMQRVHRNHICLESRDHVQCQTWRKRLQLFSEQLTF